MPEPMAQQRWLVELANAEPGRLNAARTELLWPVEKFVMEFSEKAHSEKVEMGSKQIRNPCDAQINQLKGYMGTDRQRAAQLGQGLGLAPSVFNTSSANSLCVSSAPTPEQEANHKLHEAEELQKKEEKAKKLEDNKQKHAVAKFHKNAVLASLQPELAKWGSALVEKSATAVKKAGEALSLIKNIPALLATHGACFFFFNLPLCCETKNEQALPCGSWTTGSLA